MNKILRNNTLLCFSPPVMIATMVIELFLAAWVIVRYASRTPQRLIIAILVLLAAFQYAEFNICTSSGIGLLWPRLGYDFITLLPPLGIHLVTRLRGESRPGLVMASYGAAAVFAATFSFGSSSIISGVCGGNYIILLLQPYLSHLFGVYYFGLELITLWLALLPTRNANPKLKSALRWLAAAYLAIIVPTFVIYFVLPATKVAIPSIMCGFAVILALIVGLRVAPLAESPMIAARRIGKGSSTAAKSRP